MDVNGYEAYPDEDATGHEVEDELKGAVFLAGAAPYANEEIHGDYCKFVEEEKEEQVQGEEDAVNTADEGHEQREKVLGPGLGVPGHEHGGDHDNSRQEHHGSGYAVHGEVESHTEARKPVIFFGFELVAAEVVVVGDE